MNETAKNIQRMEGLFNEGVVALENGEVFIVRIKGEAMPARQAVSCFLKPKTGDRVLVYAGNEKNAYILSVLERRQGEGSDIDIVFEGQVNLHVGNGGLTLTADRDLSLASRERVDLAAPDFSISAGKGCLNIERLFFVSRLIQTQAKTIKAIAAYMETTCRRITEKFENTFRFVTRHEEVQSRTARHLAEETFTVHAKNAVHMAEENVTINAGQIHLS